MASQSKKNSKSSPQKKSNKKIPNKKKPVKKKFKKKTAGGSSFMKNLSIVLGLLFIVSLVSFAYFLGQDETTKSTTQSRVTKKEVKTLKKETKNKSLKQEKKRVLKKPVHKVVSNVQKVTFIPYTNTKSKLVIIIDDVHTKAQIAAIRALPVKVTPSIFPPYRQFPNSHLLVRGLEHYMIHLPMESGNKKFNTQYKTLKVAFSNKKIENRIKELRQLFPKARFINNHTGSVFTSDYASMHLAYKVMRQNGFIFLDSKTVSSSKVPEIAHSYGDVYVSRDIFLDNKQSVAAIHAQLKKAVKIAKRKGYAIAIGHPHAITMKALASAKEIIKGVEVVYIDELYK